MPDIRRLGRWETSICRGVFVVVLLTDAAQNAMAADYQSLPDGIVLVGTIIFWVWFLNWLVYHVPRIQRLVRPAPLQLVRDGRLLRRNIAKELITEDELLSQLRLQGVAGLHQVKVAHMEGMTGAA